MLSEVQQWWPSYNYVKNPYPGTLGQNVVFLLQLPAGLPKTTILVAQQLTWMIDDEYEKKLIIPHIDLWLRQFKNK